MCPPISLKSKLLRNLGANAYGQLITIIIQLASAPLFLHYWGVELYGEWLILSAIPAYLSLSDIGFASVAANDMTMRVARGDKNGALQVYQSIWIFISGMSVLVGGVIALIIYAAPIVSIFSITHLSATQTQLILIALMLYVLFGLQSGVFSAAFRASGRYAYGTVLGNTVRLVEWFGSMVAVVLGGSVLSIALVTLAVRLLGLVIMWFVLRRHERWLSLGIKWASSQKIRELFKPAVAFMAFPLGLALCLQGMVLVIGMTLGSAAVVIFSAYRTLTRFLVQIITMLNQAVWPEISAAYGAGKMDLVNQIHRKGSAVTFWITLAVVTTLGFIGEWIIGIWTRHAFEQNHTLLLLMLSTTFLNVLWQTSWVVLMATNKHEKIAVVFVASSVCSILISALIVPVFGINGAAVVLAFAEIPLMVYVINCALTQLGDSWLIYLKAVVGIPINERMRRS